MPLDLQGKNVALVGLVISSTLRVTATVAIQLPQGLTCRGDPFAGEPEMIHPAAYLVGGTAFGPFISRNLRPDPETGLPANLTLEEFFEVLRLGTDFKDADFAPPGTPILQVMPWPVYGKMTDRDILAIYEYLSALPPAP